MEILKLEGLKHLYHLMLAMNKKKNEYLNIKE